MTLTTATPSVITRLNHEWQARWADREYDFPHGRMSCQQTLQLVSDRDPSADAVLRGLLTAASQKGANDEVCARTALQIVLPRVVTVATQWARRWGCSQVGAYDEPLAVSVAIAVERIKNAPLHRPGSVLGNLAMDLSKLVRRHFLAAQAEIPADPTSCTDAIEARGASDAARRIEQISETEEVTDQVLRLAAWARDHEILTEAETSMLVCYEVGSADERKALAETYAIGSRALCLRVHRVRQTLKKAVQAYALERTDLMSAKAA